MLNKILTLILVCGLIFSFAACGNIQKPTESSKVDTAENESKVFAGDYTELDNSESKLENADNSAVQNGSEEKAESHQAISSEEAPIKQEDSSSSEKPISSEAVSSEDKKQESSKQIYTASQSGIAITGFISKEKAKAIALKHAGVKEDEIFDFEIELDKEQKAWHYDISFEVGNTDYEYEIAGVSGKVLFSKSEKDDDEKPLVSRVQQPEPEISKSKAEDIVLKHAGVKKKDVSEFEIDFDNDDGRKVYEIDFKHGGYEYSYEVNAESGKVVLKEKERD